MGDPIYLDTSALVKLVLHEDESDALGAFLDDDSKQAVSSEVSDVELIRAVLRTDQSKLDRALEILVQTILLPLTTSMKLRASYLQPASLRSLDAIQVATALEIQTDLDCLIAYDLKLLSSAADAGLRVMSPGADSGPP